MNIKSDTGKLYSLIAPCIPDDKRLRRRLVLEDFFNSFEYRELKECDAFSPFFDRYFSDEVILSLSEEEIIERKNTAGLIPLLMVRLYSAVKYGNGWALSTDDIPDFSSNKSVRGLIEKLSFNVIYMNDTNITQMNVLEIFGASKNDRTDGIYCIKRTIGEGL